MTQDEARWITERLLRYFGLLDWSVHFVSFPPMADEQCVMDGVTYRRPVRRLGLCRYEPRRIELSEKHVAEDEREYIIETIVEEVAHALTPGDGHGPDFSWIKEGILARLHADAEEQSSVCVGRNPECELTKGTEPRCQMT